MISPYELEEKCNEVGGQEEVCSDNSESCAEITPEHHTLLESSITMISYFVSLKWLIKTFVLRLLHINYWGLLWKIKYFGFILQ